MSDTPPPALFYGSAAARISELEADVAALKHNCEIYKIGRDAALDKLSAARARIAELEAEVDARTADWMHACYARDTAREQVKMLREALDGLTQSRSTEALNAASAALASTEPRI